MSSQADLGQKALAAKNYDAAIKHYTEALKSSNSPLWLTQRSTAYQRSGNHDLALLDAEDAVLQAISRGKRELIAAAQMRRAIALYGLGRYGDARLCFTWVRKLNEKEPGVGTWQAMAMKEYEKLDADAEARKVTIKETPDKVMRAAPEAEESKIETPASASANTQKEIQVVAPAQTPKEKIRHEWFQSNDKVTITIFAKGVPKDKAEVNFGPESVGAPDHCYIPIVDCC
jgi:suppressor of G2 allele of SKP1